MKTNRAVLAAVLVVPATDVPPIMTDQNMRTVPPPTSPLRLGTISETQTATKLASSCRVEEMAVRPKGSACPMSSK